MARVIEDLVARRGRTPDEPLRVLVMGGGGYSLPKYLAAYVPEAHVDVVEIDPAMNRAGARVLLPRRVPGEEQGPRRTGACAW